MILGVEKKCRVAWCDRIRYEIEKPLQYARMRPRIAGVQQLLGRRRSSVEYDRVGLGQDERLTRQLPINQRRYFVVRVQAFVFDLSAAGRPGVIMADDIRKLGLLLRHRGPDAVARFHSVENERRGIVHCLPLWFANAICPKATDASPFMPNLAFSRKPQKADGR